MFNFKSLACPHCNSVIFNLPEMEVKKLKGLTFRCEDCNYKLFFNGFKFVSHREPATSIFDVVLS